MQLCELLVLLRVENLWWWAPTIILMGHQFPGNSLVTGKSMLSSYSHVVSRLPHLIYTFESRNFDDMNIQHDIKHLVTNI